MLHHVPKASNEVDGHTSPVAWHYGDPLVEQSRISSDHPGVVDRWDHVALHVSGDDAHSWLNDLISQKVNAIQPGQATWGLVLDIQGRVQHYFGISCLDDGSLLLDVPGDQANALQDYLQKMIFWAKVEVNRLDLALLTVLGGDFQSVGLSGPDEARGGVKKNWRSRTLGEMNAIDYWVPRAEITAHFDQLIADGGRATGLMAYTAQRILARQPDLALDCDDRTIPHEIPAFIGKGITGATQLENAAEGPTESAVHLNKGCYRGQETVSRVHNLGRSPRVMVLMHLDGTANTLPAEGSPVLAGGRTVGRVGSSVHDATYGPIALALVKRAVVDKLAKDPTAVPALLTDGVDASIDPDDVVSDDAARPGREAINSLRKK